MKKQILLFFTILFLTNAFGQREHYWQQHADYTMDIDVDAEKFQFKGKQKLIYTNNSPDELHKVFYHLQFNAFQPGSDMDIRLQSIPDPDSRMSINEGTRENPDYKSRIASLGPDEIGYQKIQSLLQDGKEVDYEVSGTILIVNLNQPLQPGSKTTLEMEFDGQVPVHIRRAGRNNQDGVALSMAQWYPKLAEYDVDGWQLDQYIAREFHGVWGDFDVTIHIDRDYIIGGTGYLQNPQEVGHGYEDPSKKLNLPKGKKLSWHFVAPRVHDFTWAADPDYIHEKVMGENEVELHFFYKNDKPEVVENWKKLPEKTQKILSYFNKHIGTYPYKQYSVIQGGDGGMEYAMCTLIAGGKNFGSLVGTTAHEFAHSWFQFLLATNELKYYWMDEGFTQYISASCMNEVMDQKKELPNSNSYNGYFYLVKSGKQEPLTTLADHFDSNFVYSISAYSKGSVFLSQLGYIIGKDNLDKTLLRYYEDYKFTHPTPTDFKRTAEKVSGIQLEWYMNYWINSTKVIDYEVDGVDGNSITLKRTGSMPMPLDVHVVYEDGTTEDFNIPLRKMYGHKPTKAKVLESWAWVNETYIFETEKKAVEVKIDPKNLMADVNRENNQVTPTK
ncbi:M1 family metallopeptidase [Lutimonas zeaxanthinifaciens]|uniref:M1 family metallopeptidase n=1 Tax=Lutimonas zeaxanthinifaciens TaxID=3060215 RepID=UPI00265D10EF|nr:M1 family metallopeptidase [Lutimonas sp. YSD2104]WKK66291.1 M1 family metallopeptidase [Lutimonas sp. YSD2104]